MLLTGAPPGEVVAEALVMKKAFTLIELLVVIAIIAILAAILFPVFAQAKLAAKKTSDLSNVKQIGTSLQIYLSDYDDTYPQAYYYRNDSGSGNVNGVCGYVHWTGVTQPYVKNRQIFISPGDSSGGLAPTNYNTANNNEGAGVPSGQPDSSSCAIADEQVPRLSYIANSLVMPRKRRSADPMNVISSTVIDEVSNTILLAPMTDKPNCINDASVASGTDWKTHRPTNAILLQNGTPFNGEPAAHVGLAWYRALPIATAVSVLQGCPTLTANGLSHIAYTSPYRFGGSSNDPTKGGGNYVASDTSAKFRTLAATLNQNNWLWGKRAYTAGGGEIRKDDGITPVQ